MLGEGDRERERPDWLTWVMVADAGSVALFSFPVDGGVVIFMKSRLSVTRRGRTRQLTGVGTYCDGNSPGASHSSGQHSHSRRRK